MEDFCRRDGLQRRSGGVREEGRGIEPGHVEGNVEHPEEGGEVEVVHDDGEGEALLPLHLHR
jgi:hypothetical protein